MADQLSAAVVSIDEFGTRRVFTRSDDWHGFDRKRAYLWEPNEIDFSRKFHPKQLTQRLVRPVDLPEDVHVDGAAFEYFRQA